MLLRLVVAAAALLTLAACGEESAPATPASTRTPTAAFTSTPTKTPTPVPTPPSTGTPTAADTPTPTPTSVQTYTHPPTATSTASPTPTSTNPATPTSTDTTTPTTTNTRTPTSTFTDHHPTSTSTPVPGSIVSGQLVGGTGPYPGGIEGVHFRSGTQSGFTDDSGTFTYVVGEPADLQRRRCRLPRRQRRAHALAVAARGGGAVHAGRGAESPARPPLQPRQRRRPVEWHRQFRRFPPGETSRPFAALSDADVAALVDQLIPGRTPDRRRQRGGSLHHADGR